MSLTRLGDRRTAGTPDPAEVIVITIGGRTFRAGCRTAAHLQSTFAAFAVAFPHLQLVVAQPCYNAGYEPSAGTHDGDGTLDFYVLRNGSVLTSTAADYWAVQWFLRLLGWAVWFRHTGSWASRSSWHLHGVSLGCPGPVGEFVPGQVDDYGRRALGLKGQHDSGADTSAFPADIESTVFDYPAWIEETDMPFTETQLREIVRDEVSKVLDADLNINDPGGDPAFRGWSVRRALKQILLVTGAVKRPKS